MANPIADMLREQTRVNAHTTQQGLGTITQALQQYGTVQEARRLEEEKRAREQAELNRPLTPYEARLANLTADLPADGQLPQLSGQGLGSLVSEHRDNPAAMGGAIGLANITGPGGKHRDIPGAARTARDMGSARLLAPYLAQREVANTAAGARRYGSELSLERQRTATEGAMQRERYKAGAAMERLGLTLQSREYMQGRQIQADRILRDVMEQNANWRAQLGADSAMERAQTMSASDRVQLFRAITEQGHQRLRAMVELHSSFATLADPESKRLAQGLHQQIQQMEAELQPINEAAQRATQEMMGGAAPTPNSSSARRRSAPRAPSTPPPTAPVDYTGGAQQQRPQQPQAPAGADPLDALVDDIISAGGR